MRAQTWRLVTILAAAGGLALAACSNDAGAASGTTAGGSSTSGSTSTTLPPTTTTTVPAAVAPLTGLPTDPATAARPALVVKIDNFPTIARPQVGINQADVVFEEIVEGITRFAAVFQSSQADPVGPDPIGPDERHQHPRPARSTAPRVVGRQPVRHEGDPEREHRQPDAGPVCLGVLPHDGPREAAQLLLEHLDVVLARY